MAKMKKKMSPRRPPLSTMDKVEMMQTGRKPSAGIPSKRPRPAKKAK